MAEHTAAGLLPQRKSAVDSGMSELEAGEALAGYMERVQEATGVDSDDVDLFDEKRDWTGPAKRLREDVSESSGDEPRQPPTGEQESTTEDPDAASAADQETDETETDETDDSSQEDDADTLSIEASHLAQLLGVTEDSIVVGDDGEVSFTTQVDGERGQTTLKDALASYQLQGHVTKKSQRLSEEFRARQEQLAQREAELVAAVEQAQSFQKAMVDRVVEKYSKVDWDALNAQDPGRYAALQVQMNNEVQGIHAEASAVQAAAQEQMAKSRQEFAARRDEWLRIQREEVVKHIPALGDETTRVPTLRSYEDYLMGLGFTTDEVRNMHDHRYLRVVADAVAAHEARKANGGKNPPRDKASEVVKKRLVRVPRVARGSVPQAPGDDREARKRSSMKALRNSGSDEDAARFLLESGVAAAVLGD